MKLMMSGHNDRTLYCHSQEWDGMADVLLSPLALAHILLYCTPVLKCDILVCLPNWQWVSMQSICLTPLSSLTV